ncbi:MAG: glycosyltransferase family 4 protein [Chloroflexi bacterium]|nr:glycosyltransferase family 4 protein [Chloroflexota bacterium]
MRACLNISPAIQGRAGLGRYTASLLRALLAIDPHGDYAVFYNRSREGQPPAPFDRLPRYASPLGDKPWRLRAALTYFGAPRLDSWFPGVGLFHATDHLLPRFRGIRTIVTLHDLIPLILPEHHLPLNRWFLKLMFPRFLAAADAIIAVSECSRRDAQRLLNVPPDKFVVIPEGVEPHFKRVADPETLAAVRAKYRLPERFILIVSTIEPRKNHAHLLEAYRRLRETHSGTGLVIAGKPGWLYQSFFERLKASGLENEVIVTGPVPEADLPALLSLASAFAFPSLYEGMGLPPLEAMACGTPVVASNTSSLPEAVGDAGILLPPSDPRQWAEALGRVLDDATLRADLSARGIARTAQFTWEAAAEATLAVYQRVALLNRQDATPQKQAGQASAKETQNNFAAFASSR